MFDIKKLSPKAIIKKIKPEGKRIKNRALLKRGSYSLILTCVTLAVLVVLNMAVAALAKKVNLEYDMTAKKVNSISKENADYLKDINEDVVIYVCGKKSDYTLYLMSKSEELYNAYSNEKLFDLTLNLLDKYEKISDRITVKYVDTQSVDYVAITQSYPDESIAYGDIIVASQKGDNDRYKHLTFYDIYNLTDSTGYATYGYTSYEIDENRLETALTSAINYVVNEEIKSVLLYKGHSSADYSSAYGTLLNDNNYKTAVSNDQLLTGISDEYDGVVILAPSRDFLQNELDALSAFLENGGNYGKGLVFIADAANPELPALYGFLSEWGITISGGTLLETNSDYMINAELPTAVISYPAESNGLTDNMYAFVSGYNVPMEKSRPLESSVTVKSIASTFNTVVAAPVGAGSDWSDYKDSDLKNYDTIIEAELDESGRKSYVYAVSSIEFISSEWAENSRIANKDILLLITNKACGKSDTAITFVNKSILTEGYTNDITNAKVVSLRRFLYTIPVIILIAGIVVYIRRRNAK